MRKGSHLNVKELSAYFMLVPYSASAGRFRSTFVLCRLDKDHFSDWPGLLPTHRELFFLTELPHNKTPQTGLESWDVLLISPPPRSVQKRGYRRASEEEIARECHSSALRWGDENGLLYCMIRGAPTSIPSEKAFLPQVIRRELGVKRG
jgi:hypothetical protein